MSIQMIALRNEFAAFSRRADAKISLLREIVERVKKGETVDVEGLLGTGDYQKEKEWEERMFCCCCLLWGVELTYLQFCKKSRKRMLRWRNRKPKDHKPPNREKRHHLHSLPYNRKRWTKYLRSRKRLRRDSIEFQRCILHLYNNSSYYDSISLNTLLFVRGSSVGFVASFACVCVNPVRFNCSTNPGSILSVPNSTRTPASPC